MYQEVSGTIASRQLDNDGIVTIDRQGLYELVKMAVYDALSRLDFLTIEEFKLRENAMEELVLCFAETPEA